MENKPPIEGIFNIAVKLGMQKNFTRLSGILSTINAPKKINQRGMNVYSLTEEQVEIINFHLNQMRKELNCEYVNF